MSRQNKVNKSNYDQAGRLTPDEIARERARQREHARGVSEEHISGRADHRDAPAPNRRQTGREE